MTATQKAPGAGKLVAAILVTFLLPAIVFFVGFGVGIASVASSTNLFHEVPVDQVGTARLEAGEYAVYSAGSFGAEMTITGPDGQEVPQRPRSVTGNSSTTVDGTEFNDEADVTLPTTGEYELSVTGLSGASTGSMALGPSPDEIGRKLGIPIAIGAALAFLIFVIGLIWMITVIRARGRAKRSGPGSGSGAPPGYPQPGYPQPGYPQPGAPPGYGQPPAAPQPGYVPPPGAPPQPGL